MSSPSAASSGGPSPAGSAPAGSTPAGSTAAGSALTQRGTGLRPVALAVAFLAALDVLVSIGIELARMAARWSEAAGYALQGAFLVSAVVAALLTAAVVLLVQRAARPEGRLVLPAVLILGLQTVALLLVPLWGTVSTFLSITRGPMPGPGATPELFFLVTQGIDILITLTLGLIALLLALRSAAEPRTVRIPGAPKLLSVMLCALAGLFVVIIPVNAVTRGLLFADSPVIAALAGVPSLVLGACLALLVPVGALLIARTSGTPRRLTWSALGVLWASSVLITLLSRLQLLLFALGVGTDFYQLWGAVPTIVQLLAALVILVVSILVLVAMRWPGPGVRPLSVGGAPTP